MQMKNSKRNELTLPDLRSQKSFVGIAVGVWLFVLPMATEGRAMSGYITDRQGRPIAGVSVIASGRGFKGWAESKADGSFTLQDFGAFVSFRHESYRPLLIRSSELKERVRVELDPVDMTVWKLKSCSTSPRKDSWVGGGLRINIAGRYEGPVYGEHDSHWYVRRGSGLLHVVDGYAWHAGLPPEETLVSSESISVRGWIFENIVGLDLAGRSTDGKYWRWIGAPIEDAIEYQANSRDVADYFDEIIKTTCVSTLAYIR
jgi:hypothetical protein